MDGIYVSICLIVRHPKYGVGSVCSKLNDDNTVSVDFFGFVRVVPVSELTEA